MKEKEKNESRHVHMGWGYKESYVEQLQRELSKKGVQNAILQP